MSGVDYAVVSFHVGGAGSGVAVVYRHCILGLEVE